MKTHSEKFLRQRRFYMVLPMLVLPFITMIFWALGGGQGTPVKAEEIKSGLNLNLPGAHFDKEDELWDKFSLYEQAKRDSQRYEEAKRNDPYYVVSMLKTNAPQDSVPGKSKLNPSLGVKDKYTQISEQEELINTKLDELNRQLSQPESGSASNDNTNQSPKKSDAVLSDDGDIARLEAMMQMMSSPGASDPEMQQIEGVLEKILDIQHPERVVDKIKEQSLQHRTQVYPVQPVGEEEYISMIESPATSDSSVHAVGTIEVGVAANAFYGLDDSSLASDQPGNAIEAVVHDTQTLVAGSTIRLRLLSDVYIDGNLIPKDQFIYGTCSIAGERLVVKINSVRDDRSLFPVSLKVYDLDGMEGIYIPGAITRDAAKQATSQSIQDMQLYSMDNSLGVQAATAGIEAAKGLFAKKAKLIKITVKAGYHILLKDANQNQS
jgi:conjugative transposon TraM protein